MPEPESYPLRCCCLHLTDLTCEVTQKDRFFKVLSAASAAGRLGIFSMECQHRQNRAIAEASAPLGRAKNWLKLSVESFLGSAKSWHGRRQKLKVRETLA